MVWLDGLRLLVAVAAAYVVGRLVARMKLPAILGWLVTGMVLGPHALDFVQTQLLEAPWYRMLESVLECVVGLMIGTELIWSQLKRAGRQIVVTTLTESLGTFLVVAVVFAGIFWVAGVPVWLALVFGGIALATAPAPSLSIVSQMQADGPVTRTLIPMAALDDLVAAVVFFSVVAYVSARVSNGSVPLGLILLVILLPIALGIVTGWIAGLLLRRVHGKGPSVAVMLAVLAVAAAAGLAINWLVLPSPTLNFMLIGMAYSTVFANMARPEQNGQIMSVMQPVIGLGLIVVIVNLGAPLDYHLILGAGAYTAVYILSRAVGKYFGARVGAAATHAPQTVQRYLGLTLLPHSGVSLVFTGVAVSVLQGPEPACAQIVQGTIAAAAVINEILAVLIAKKGFEWAGELPQGRHPAKEGT